MRLSDFSYSLPRPLVAQTPVSPRDAGRMLHILPRRCAHLRFIDLPGLLDAGDVLVVNDTRVVKARVRGEKDSGGRAEVLVERIENEFDALCQVRVSKPLKTGRFVAVHDKRIEVLARVGEFYRLRFPAPVMSFLDQWGETPLPPYIERQVSAQDAERYQTVYGKTPGAVAAPTAGLHFTERILGDIKARGVAVVPVTLHVGTGTFQPVRVDDLSRHQIHAERYEIPPHTATAVDACRRHGGRVIAVGTTVVRALETAAGGAVGVVAGAGETDLFITPGFDFRVVNALLTNFHMPESTLLMLVCAFGGYDRIMSAYALAVAERYRFFSYGDACFLERMGEL